MQKEGNQWKYEKVMILTINQEIFNHQVPALDICSMFSDSKVFKNIADHDTQPLLERKNAWSDGMQEFSYYFLRSHLP